MAANIKRIVLKKLRTTSIRRNNKQSINNSRNTGLERTHCMYFTGQIFALHSFDVKTPKILIEWMISGYCDVTKKMGHDSRIVRAKENLKPRWAQPKTIIRHEQQGRH